MSKKPSIDELEKILNSEEETLIQIMPNGEVREASKTSSSELSGKKPLTFKENLGGEYSSLGRF